MTKLQIFNIALLGVGTEMLSFESDRNRNGDMCRTYYPIAAKTVLEKFPWSCALTRVKLTPLEDTDPDYNLDLYDAWEYQYALPDDCLRVHSVAGSTETKRLVNRGFLYSNVEAPLMDYIRDVSEPADQGEELPFAPTLCDAIARLMSYRIAPTVAPDKNTNLLFSEFQNAMEEAMNEDGREMLEDVGSPWKLPYAEDEDWNY